MSEWKLKLIKSYLMTIEKELTEIEWLLPGKANKTTILYWGLLQTWGAFTTHINHKLDKKKESHNDRR